MFTQLSYQKPNLWKWSDFFLFAFRIEKKHFQFIATLCFLVTGLFSSNISNGQGTPPECGNIVCTANDVRIGGAFIADADGKPLDCTNGGTIQAYIYLRVYSQGPREGFYFSSKIVVNNVVQQTAISYCSPDDLRKGSNNIVKLPDPIQYQCGTALRLTDVYVAYNQNGNQCVGNSTPTCPGTKSKCRSQVQAGDPDIIIDVPNLAIDFSSLESDCDGNSRTVEFTATASGGTPPYSYTISYGAGTPATETINTSSTTQKFTHAYVSGHTYNVTLTVSDATTSTPKTTTLNQNLIVTACCTAPNAGTDGGTLKICAGSTVTEEQLFAVIGTHDAGGTWMPTFAGAGTYTYTVNATSPCSGTATATVTVTEQAAPNVNFTVGTQTCSGGLASIPLIGEVSNNTSFAWTTSGDGTFSNTTLTPVYTPGSKDRATRTVTITLTANVASDNPCSAAVKMKTVTVSPCGAYFTYTQGYYGNKGGTSCTPAGSKTTLQLIQQSLINLGGTLYLGRAGASFTMSYTDAAKLITILPGGSTAGKLAANYDLDALTIIPLPPLKTGKIANVLLSQTIALALNINITGNGLRSVILQNGYLTTITKSGSSCTAAAATCQNGGVISSKKITSNTALATLLNGKTVADLLTIASNALGGTLPSGVTYSDISSAVDVINNLFDGGRYSLGFFPCQKTCSNLTVACATSASITLSNRTSLETTEEIAKLSVSTYPNPYSNNVRFTVANPKAGQGSLEVFNMLGQKVKTVYQGFIPKGSQTYQMNGAALQHGNLIYRLHVGNTQVTGKLLHAKE